MKTCLFILLSLLRLAGAASGQLAFTLTPAAQIGTATNEMCFTGALTNNGASNLYLNGIRCALLSPASNVLAPDTNAFFANVPGILLPGQVYTDVVFAVALGPVAPPGIYNGSITILGGSNIFASNNLASAAFQVSLPDSVGDGIPDWWRQFYFGGDGASTNGQSCATCDADGTGQNNFFKYVVGLNPTNSVSMFIFTLSNPPPTLVSGPMAAGRTVTPQYSDDLSSGAWQPVVPPILTTSNHSAFDLTDPTPSSTARFYRIEISLPSP
jgi:hypothetical protein